MGSAPSPGAPDELLTRYAPIENLSTDLHRRAFLCRAGATLGTAALASLLNPAGVGSSDAATPPGSDPWSGVVQPRHHAPRARRVIQLYMAGGPSHLETFDFKPQLKAMHGRPMPESLTRGQPIAQLQNEKQLRCFGPQWGFRRVGRAGHEIGEIFPRLHEVADELCVICSLHTDAINHDPAHTFMNTGSLLNGRPAMGSWVTYGLGSASEDLPGFIVLTSKGKYGPSQPLLPRQWHSGFLPGKFQGVEFRGQGDPVLYLRNPAGVSTAQQRALISAVQELNRQQARLVDDPEIATRIEQYELAFRMQASVPALMDLSQEPRGVFDLYGAKPGDGSFASNCLLARRLAERGVRFIQLYHREWDHHFDLRKNIRGSASEVDQGMAALLKDLKRLDMLKDTLVIWNGEFGRTPMAQGDGRDHHQKGFSIWLAGGGIRAGMVHGATDDFGYHAVVDRMHVNDLHATVLHLLGIDHTRLTYRFQGRDFRLTDVRGEVVKAILA